MINEPMIADPDVNNEDVSKRYTHDTIRPLSFYGGTKKVDLGFIGSCMIHKGDMQILAQMLKNIEAKQGKIEFKEFNMNTNLEQIRILSAPVTITVEPNIAHLLTALEDTVFLEFFDFEYFLYSN